MTNKDFNDLDLLSNDDVQERNENDPFADLTTERDELSEATNTFFAKLQALDEAEDEKIDFTNFFSEKRAAEQPKKEETLAVPFDMDAGLKEETKFPDEPVEMSEDSSLERTAQLPVVDEVSPEPKQPKKEKNKHVFKKNMTFFYVLLTLLTIAANAFVLYELFNSTKFASLNHGSFIKLNIAVLAGLLILDLVMIIMIRSKKTYMFALAVILLAGFFGAGAYADYALKSIDTNLGNLTNTTSEENVATSLIIYSGTDGAPIVNIADVKDRNVGILSGSKTAEVAKNRFNTEGVPVNYVEYTDYQDILSGLIGGEVDCGVLPSAYSSQYAEVAGISEYLDSMSSILDFSDKVSTTTAAGADKDITSEPFTVLVTGENEGLADTIILMSVNPVSMKVTMTSIARDSYVPISCYGFVSSKINSAHASSEDCLVQTVENLTGINIDYTIEFNFASVIQVVDAVGGIDIDVEATFHAQSWDIETDTLYVIPMEAGFQHINGQQALGYARERYAFEDGDFARQRHQQEIIELVVEKVMNSSSPQMFLNILEAAGDNIKTNFTVDQMTGFITYAMQKAKRYYNPGSVAGVFNFVTSRIYGYNGQMWDNSLGMYLYIYPLYDGSIRDNVAAIQRNQNLHYPYTVPAPVNWSASTTYTPDPISQEYYAEGGQTTIGGPTVTETPSQNDNSYTYTPEPTTEPEPSVTPEPVPDVTPEPEPTPTPEEPGEDVTE